jgi:hypothetical protein
MKRIFFSLITSILFISCGNDLEHIKADESGRLYGNLEIVSKSIIDYRVRDLCYVQGRLYSLDRGSQLVNVYSQDLEYINSHGKKGGGPGEFSNVVSFTPVGNDILAVLDVNKNAVKFISLKDGQLVDYFKVPIKFERGAILKNGSDIIVQGTSPGFHLDFTKLSRNGKEWSIVENIPIDSLFSSFDGSSIRDDGFFAQSPNDELYYVSYLSGNTYRFTENGVLEAKGQAVHEIIEPKVILEENFAAPGKSEIYVISVAANNDYLFVVSRLPDDEGNIVLDCYDGSTLKYVQSFALPYLDELGLEAITLIEVDGEMLYAATENYIVKINLDL